MIWRMVTEGLIVCRISWACIGYVGGTGAVTARRLLRPTYILREDVAIDGAVVFQEI